MIMGVWAFLAFFVKKKQLIDLKFHFSYHNPVDQAITMSEKSKLLERDLNTHTHM